MDETLQAVHALGTAGELWLPALGLSIARAGGVLAALPHATSNAMPALVRGIVVLSISAALTFATPPTPGLFTGPGGELVFLVLAVRELLFGLAMGFSVHVALAVARIAGEIAGVEMGMSFAAVADPLSQTESTPASSLIGQLGIQLFLAAGLDAEVLRALAASTTAIPLGTASMVEPMLSGLGEQISGMLHAAIVLAMPIMAATFALKLAMAALAKMTPKLQIFTLAFGMTVTLGLFVLAAALPTIGAGLLSYFREAVASLRAFTVPIGP